MTAYRLERGRERIGLKLVIARDDPDLAPHLDPDLRRAGDMARRVERHPRLADLPRLAVADGVERDIPQPVAHHRGSEIRCEIGPMPVAGVIGMAVGDQRPRDRAPRVDVEIAGGTVEPLWGDVQDHAPMIGPARPVTSPLRSAARGLCCTAERAEQGTGHAVREIWRGRAGTA